MRRNEILDEDFNGKNFEKKIANLNKKIKIGRIGYFIIVGFYLIRFYENFQNDYPFEAYIQGLILLILLILSFTGSLISFIIGIILLGIPILLVFSVNLKPSEGVMVSMISIIFLIYGAYFSFLKFQIERKK